MGRFGGIRRPFLAGVFGIALLGAGLAACSSDKKASPPSTTTTATSSTTSAPETSTSTSTTEATTVPTTTASTTTPTTGRSGVRITAFTISPAAPVCNSPTEIQLSWTAIGAGSVDLSIDGAKFASYPGGTQSHLGYFACDGKPHTYLLTAHGPGGGRATASKVVRATATG